ncbi:hypothetical protein HF325_001679 [Metschnikowia pulcherrima]|uniref:Uncharacterized protein n=1 Tax=Metschnikowia pulcherrima TaxID=27326 RepID=A0A8H7GX50_9ASCO|nr:hypothetical protein HF325_001679 [Metschnikowia pulcherrima]
MVAPRSKRWGRIRSARPLRILSGSSGTIAELAFLLPLNPGNEKQRRNLVDKPLNPRILLRLAILREKMSVRLLAGE